MRAPSLVGVILRLLQTRQRVGTTEVIAEYRRRGWIVKPHEVQFTATRLWRWLPDAGEHRVGRDIVLGINQLNGDCGFRLATT